MVFYTHPRGSDAVWPHLETPSLSAKQKPMFIQDSSSLFPFLPFQNIHNPGQAWAFSPTSQLCLQCDKRLLALLSLEPSPLIPSWHSYYLTTESIFPLGNSYWLWTSLTLRFFYQHLFISLFFKKPLNTVFMTILKFLRYCSLFISRVAAWRAENP